MGIDAVFKARTHPRLDREAFEDLRCQLHEAFPDRNRLPSERYRWPDLTWDAYEDEPTIEMSCLQRYYGPGYERGPWPEIRELGDWLVEALPSGAEVRYGGDCDDGWGEMSPWSEVAPECDHLWATVGNEPYRAFFRRTGSS